MFPGYIIFLTLFLAFAYIFARENTQVGATASAIRQVWYGRCRLACRPTESSYNGSSAPSAGLPESDLVQPGPGTSRECVCGTCPCALVENVIKSCSPATRLYVAFTENLSYYYYYVVKAITDGFPKSNNVLGCNTCCSREARLARANDYSSENFKFAPREPGLEGRQTTDNQKTAQEVSRLDKSSVNFKQTPSQTSLAHETDSNTVSRSCPKCVKKDKTCLGDCPKAKK